MELDQDTKDRIVEKGNELVKELDKLGNQVPHGPNWSDDHTVMEWNVKYELTARSLIEARVAMRNFLEFFRKEQ